MIVQSLNKITLETFKEAVYSAVTSKITNVAPLGYSSPTFLLYGKDGNERRCGVSVRNHSGNVSMLICDMKGRFIFHGGFDKNLPIDFITSELFLTFKKLKKFIETELPKNDDIERNCVNHPRYTSGFDFLATAQCRAFHSCV
ncbi:MAG: hypothetical protein JWR05_3487 [Mucilaginibacter sp.]|nr:hypothetical protein [Mucilaginibacter sp.]